MTFSVKAHKTLPVCFGSFSPTVSPRQSPDRKIQANKPGHTKKPEHAVIEPSSKSPGNKVGVWAATQNGEKGPATLRPADTGRKPDWKDTRGESDLLHGSGG